MENKIPNNECIIYKFDWVRSKRDTMSNRSIKLRKRISSDAGLLTNFKIALIDKFSPENFDALLKYTFWQDAYHKNDPIKFPNKMTPYKKDWLIDQYEIGLDMLKEKYGMRFEYHWMSWYVLVPKKEEEIIKWIDENKPYYVEIMKRI